jgi:hypothetical protein
LLYHFYVKFTNGNLKTSEGMKYRYEVAGTHTKLLASIESMQPIILQYDAKK